MTRKTIFVKRNIHPFTDEENENSTAVSDIKFSSGSRSP